LRRVLPSSLRHRKDGRESIARNAVHAIMTAGGMSRLAPFTRAESAEMSLLFKAMPPGTSRELTAIGVPPRRDFATGRRFAPPLFGGGSAFGR
jgi:hypothetical protein